MPHQTNNNYCIDFLQKNQGQQVSDLSKKPNYQLSLSLIYQVFFFIFHKP